MDGHGRVVRCRKQATDGPCADPAAAASAARAAAWAMSVAAAATRAKASRSRPQPGPSAVVGGHGSSASLARSGGGGGREECSPPTPTGTPRPPPGACPERRWPLTRAPRPAPWRADAALGGRASTAARPRPARGAGHSVHAREGYGACAPPRCTVQRPRGRARAVGHLRMLRGPQHPAARARLRVDGSASMLELFRETRTPAPPVIVVPLLPNVALGLPRQALSGGLACSMGVWPPGARGCRPGTKRRGRRRAPGTRGTGLGIRKLSGRPYRSGPV